MFVLMKEGLQWDKNIVLSACMIRENFFFVDLSIVVDSKHYFVYRLDVYQGNNK